MLILSRKRDEEIVIGPEREVVIKVVEISPHQVRIGIEADKHIPVWRKEVLLRMDAEKEAD